MGRQCVFRVEGGAVRVLKEGADDAEGLVLPTRREFVGQIAKRQL